jgi:hypothetical protein
MDDFELKPSTGFVKFQPNNPLMAKSEPVFFYEKAGKTLALVEREAAFLESSSHKHLIKQIGVSDGKTYRKTLLNSGVKAGEIISVERANEIMKKAFEAELEKARGHFRRPIGNHFYGDAGISEDQKISIMQSQK